MEIRELFTILRRFWLLAAVILAGAVLLGYSAAYLPAQKYKATAILLVAPASKKIDYTTVQTVQYLLPSLAAQVGTTSFIERVRSRVPTSVPWDNVSLKAAPEAGTSIVRVQAKTLHPVSAAIIANIAARELIQRKLSNLVEVKLLDGARPPAGAFSPNRKLIMFAAAVIGLIAGILAAIGANALLPRVRTASEIRRRFGLEVIAEIPQARGFPRSASRLFDPSSNHTELIEAYHRLRANLGIVADGRRRIAVTSAVASEGKSSVTANLAWAIASLGENVVAVDTDLRRPTLHEYFGLRLGTGVADVPLGVDIEDLAQATDLPTLRVIPAGYAVEHPQSILHNSYAKILETFHDSLVIVDVPPLLSTADATLVTTMTGAALVVADARRGDSGELDQVLHELERARVDVLGLVLNRVTLKRSQRADVYYSELARRASTSPKRSKLRALLGGNREHAGPGPVSAAGTVRRRSQRSMDRPPAPTAVESGTAPSASAAPTRPKQRRVADGRPRRLE